MSAFDKLLLHCKGLLSLHRHLRNVSRTNALPTDRDRAQLVFGGVVVDPRAPVVDEALERGPLIVR
jgi:hypothetical protein